MLFIWHFLPVCNSDLCHVDVEQDVHSKMSAGNQISAPNSENSSNEPFRKEHKQSQWKPFIHQGCVVLSLPQLLVFWATGKATQSGTAPDTSVLWFYVKQLQSGCWQQVFPSSQWFMKPCSSMLRALRQNISTRKCCSERCHNAVLKGVRPQQDFRLLQHTTMSHRSGSVEYLGSGKLMGSMKVG